MRLLPTLFLFSELIALSPNAIALATCPGASYACSPLTIAATISLTPGTPESPIIFYVNNQWGGNFGMNRGFGNSINSNTQPPAIEYPITFGTLNLNTGEVILKGASKNEFNNKFYLINTDNEKINYTVAYTDCQNSTPNQIDPSETLLTSQIQMAGINPVCHPDPLQGGTAKPGNGAGELVFTLAPPPYPAGDYTDTFTLTACTTDSACN